MYIAGSLLAVELVGSWLYMCALQDVAAKVMKPLGEKVSQVVAFCEKRRGSKVFNHLMTIKEGIGCVGWVSVSPKPAPYVKEMYDQALFYGNRVIKEFKGKNE